MKKAKKKTKAKKVTKPVRSSVRKNPKDKHEWVERPGGWSCKTCGTFKSDPDETGESGPIYFPPGEKAVMRPIPACKTKEAA